MILRVKSVEPHLKKDLIAPINILEKYDDKKNLEKSSKSELNGSKNI